MAGNSYSPLSEDCVVREKPVDALAAKTLALGMPPPLESSTWPCSVAVTVCAPEGITHKEQRIERGVQRANVRIFIVPPSNIFVTSRAFRSCGVYNADARVVKPNPGS